jgi:hypothetical protein
MACISETEQLEQVDESLMRRSLEVGQWCPKEILYLELGCMPIRYTIKIRKILFLHYLLNEENDSLISRVLKAQIENPSKMTSFWGSKMTWNIWKYICA